MAWSVSASKLGSVKTHIILLQCGFKRKILKVNVLDQLSVECFKISSHSPPCVMLMLSEVEELQQAESTPAADSDYLVVGQQQVPRSSSTSDITEPLCSDSSQGMWKLHFFV